MKIFDQNKSWPSIILITSLGIIVYSNTFFCSFQFDDWHYIVGNSFITSFQNLLTHWQFYPCRFITFLSIVLNYHFNGLNVFGYHLFNLAIHLASAILVWWLTILTLSTPAMKEDKITEHAHLIALLIGLVFVSHPLGTESVTYIWQRATSMAAMFYLASLCLYVKARLFVCGPGACLSPSEQTADHKDRPYYIASLIMAVMAMFTKENTVTLPLMILLYEFSFFKFKKISNLKYLFPFPKQFYLQKLRNFNRSKSLSVHLVALLLLIIFSLNSRFFSPISDYFSCRSIRTLTTITLFLKTSLKSPP